MLRRILPLLRAHLGAWSAGGAALTTAAVHGLLCLMMGALLNDLLPTFGYALFAQGLAWLLLAVPLLGDQGALMRADPAGEWVQSLPATPLEHRLARLGALGFATALLASASILPLSLLAPGLGLLGKLVFFICGLGSVAVLVSALIALQALLSKRFEGLLLTLQVALTAAVLLGALLAVPKAGQLAPFDTLEALPAAGRWLPWAWFAAPFGPDGLRWGLLWIPLLALALAKLAVVLLPLPTAPAGTGATANALVRPLRALATRLWVRPGPERAGFDLVIDALPAEREVALRTAPMLGIPLAFAAIASTKEPGPERDGLLALLLFTPGFYLPLLLSHIPASESAAARWLQDTAPARHDEIHRGALKAVVVRYLIPLHLALGAIAWNQGGLDLALRLALPATFVSLLVTRLVYRSSVTDLPLSIAPVRVGTSEGLGGPLMVIGVGLAIVAVIAERKLTTPALGAAVAAVLLILEVLLERTSSLAPDPAGPTAEEA